MNRIHRGVIDLQISTRLLDLRPTSFDDTEHTVEAVLSMGSPVPRFYGIESLRITKDAIDLSRMQTTGIPVIDSHQQTSIDHALGKLTHAWVSNGGLFGVIKFNRTDGGMRAEGMIKRGELGGVSVGYRVLEWEVQDGDGNIIDADHYRWGDDDLTFVGKNWELLEVSICAVPADAQSGFRNDVDLVDRAYLAPLPPHLVDIHARMVSRQRMVVRHSRL
jgi:HK97 family phage prohead protease